MLVVSDHYYKLVSGRVTQIMKNSLFKKKNWWTVRVSVLSSSSTVQHSQTIVFKTTVNGSEMTNAVQQFRDLKPLSVNDTEE